jgi:hypothetical protein
VRPTYDGDPIGGPIVLASKIDGPARRLGSGLDPIGGPNDLASKNDREARRPGSGLKSIGVPIARASTAATVDGRHEGTRARPEVDPIGWADRLGCRRA